MDSSSTAHRPNTTNYKNYILVLAKECKPEILPEHWGSGRADPVAHSCESRGGKPQVVTENSSRSFTRMETGEQSSRRKAEDAVLIVEADETDRG